MNKTKKLTKEQINQSDEIKKLWEEIIEYTKEVEFLNNSYHDEFTVYREYKIIQESLEISEVEIDYTEKEGQITNIESYYISLNAELDSLVEFNYYQEDKLKTFSKKYKDTVEFSLSIDKNRLHEIKVEEWEFENIEEFDPEYKKGFELLYKRLEYMD